MHGYIEGEGGRNQGGKGGRRNSECRVLLGGSEHSVETVAGVQTWRFGDRLLLQNVWLNVSKHLPHHVKKSYRSDPSTRGVLFVSLPGNKDTELFAHSFQDPSSPTLRSGLEDVWTAAGRRPPPPAAARLVEVSRPCYMMWSGNRRPSLTSPRRLRVIFSYLLVFW